MTPFNTRVFRYGVLQSDDPDLGINVGNSDRIRIDDWRPTGDDLLITPGITALVDPVMDFGCPDIDQVSQSVTIDVLQEKSIGIIAAR